MVAQLDLPTKGILKNAVTLGLRCRCLPWVGFTGGSRGALRTGSPRILCRCPVLRRQVLGLCRRGMGAESRGHRGRNRGCQALPEGGACPNRAGRTVDVAVTRPHLSSSKMRNACPGCCAARSGALLIRGPLCTRIALGPGSAVHREERCTASGTRDALLHAAAPHRSSSGCTQR